MRHLRRFRTIFLLLVTFLCKKKYYKIGMSNITMILNQFLCSSALVFYALAQFLCYSLVLFVIKSLCFVKHIQAELV